MRQAPPVTYAQYLEELEKELTALEKAADRASSLDERINVTNKLLIENLKVLREGLKFQLPEPVPPEVDLLAPYNIRKFALDTARTEPGEEVAIPGDIITAYTNGTLSGCYIRFDSATNDAIPLNEFNPLRYPAKFKKFYLETTAQSGKYLRLHIGREAGAEAAFQITAIAAKPAFYTLKSDKDDHFTGALTTGNKEDENLVGLLGNKAIITNIAIQADQALDLWLMFWRKDSFEDSDLDVDTFIGAVELDLSTFGRQVGGAGQYYMSLEGVDLEYEDEDGSHELHVSLYNADTTSKNAGATGQCVVFLKYELRA